MSFHFKFLEQIKSCSASFEMGYSLVDYKASLDVNIRFFGLHLMENYVLNAWNNVDDSIKNRIKEMAIGLIQSVWFLPYLI